MVHAGMGQVFEEAVGLVQLLSEGSVSTTLEHLSASDTPTDTLTSRHPAGTDAQFEREPTVSEESMADSPTPQAGETVQRQVEHGGEEQEDDRAHEGWEHGAWTGHELEADCQDAQTAGDKLEAALSAVCLAVSSRSLYGEDVDAQLALGWARCLAIRRQAAASALG